MRPAGTHLQPGEAWPSHHVAAERTHHPQHGNAQRYPRGLLRLAIIHAWLDTRHPATANPHQWPPIRQQGTTTYSTWCPVERPDSGGCWCNDLPHSHSTACSASCLLRSLMPHHCMQPRISTAAARHIIQGNKAQSQQQQPAEARPACSGCSTQTHNILPTDQVNAGRSLWVSQAQRENGLPPGLVYGPCSWLPLQ